MTRRAVALLALLALVGPAALVARAGGPVEDACYARSTSATTNAVCRSVRAGAWATTAQCRLAVSPLGDPAVTEACAAIDGRPVSRAQLAAYRSSWVHRALQLQRELDNDAPLLDGLIPHTHNSFNSSAYSLPTDPARPGYYPTVTNQDPNQAYTITDQLEMDIRAIEIDAHWVPSPFGSAATGGRWPTMCHGQTQGPVHVGCTFDRPLQDGLQEVAAWSDAHPGDLVLLYLEDQLDDSSQAHEVAGGLIQEVLGARVVPTARSCEPLPATRTPASLLAEGHRILLVGNCSTATAGSWGLAVHERRPVWDEHGRADSYDAAACAADSAARAGRTSFRRYFEDQTWLGAAAESNPATESLAGNDILSTEHTAAMVRCGVNIIGFDQLVPTDPRLAALVWSWAPDQPSTGDCAYLAADGRLHSGDCSVPREHACSHDGSAWGLDHSAGAWTEVAGCTYAVPRNGWQMSQLVAAAHGQEVWVAYHRAGPTAPWSTT